MLKLFFPQWQDSGDSRLYEGALALRNLINLDKNFHEVSVPKQEMLSEQDGIIGKSSILRQISSAQEIIEKSHPERIFTLGGGCGVEIAPISYLNTKYQSKLGVLWFDAHGDLNTPASSPSHHFHGMPLRTLLSEGDKALMDFSLSHLTPEQVMLCGSRSLDLPELQFIENNNIVLITSELLLMTDVLQTMLRVKKWENVYVHLDLDILDPNEFDSVLCPENNGITIDQLLSHLTAINRECNVVGCSMLECLRLETSQQHEVAKKIAIQLLSMLS